MIPGLHPDRLLRLMREAVARCELNLSGLTVLTEAATGAYVVTPVLAALSGARRVYALAKDSRYGTAEQAVTSTLELARRGGVEQAIEVIGSATSQILKTVDIVTNSGHVRPLDAAKIEHLKPGAVVPLMYESWELRDSDIDLAACRRRGIRVGGTNEQHPSIGVFNFLGTMAIKLLLDAGVCVYGSRVLLVCDNAFGPYLETGLRSAGACIKPYAHLSKMTERLDAVLVATTPAERPLLSDYDLHCIAKQFPGAVIAQFFGDVNRRTLQELDLCVWPEKEPEKCHMGILPSAIGPEPIVRLQSGGLKVGEVLYRGHDGKSDPSLEFAQPV